jgi:hypothetical protein
LFLLVVVTLGTLCDRPYFANGDGLSSLDRAEQKCGGQSPFAFIKESDDGKKSGGSVGSGADESTFLEMSSPLDIAMAISQPKTGGGAMLGLTSKQKKIISSMNQKRMKSMMLPRTCEGILLQPGQIVEIRKQVDCIANELKSKDFTINFLIVFFNLRKKY